jgi:hypothetical protein
MADKSNQNQRSRKAANDRPQKPYSDFPLYAPHLDYWSKKVFGKIHHFGRWGRTRNGKIVRIREDGCRELRPMA